MFWHAKSDLTKSIFIQFSTINFIPNDQFHFCGKTFGSPTTVSN